MSEAKDDSQTVTFLPSDFLTLIGEKQKSERKKQNFSLPPLRLFLCVLCVNRIFFFTQRAQRIRKDYVRN